MRNGALHYKIFWQLLLAFAFLIPVSQFLSVRILFVVFLFSFFIKKDRLGLVQIIRNSWDIILYFLVLIFGLIYSNDLETGVKVLETSFSLFALPLIFRRVIPFNKKSFHALIFSFSIGLILTCLICLTNAAIRFYYGGSASVFFFDELTLLLNIQPTYLAYYLCFAITMGLYVFYYKESRVPEPYLIGILIFLFVVLMLSGGRTAYLSMLFVFSFFILKYLFEDERPQTKKIAFALVLIFLVSMLLINHYNFNATSEKASASGDYWERMALWKSAVEANPDILFGVGTGDYKNVMNGYYNSHNLAQFAQDSFNAHNQFLQLFFSNGLIGLFSIILLIGRPLYICVRHQNVLGILVFFSFLIYGMTEVFLGRYQGVVFFALLHQIFITEISLETPRSISYTQVNQR